MARPKVEEPRQQYTVMLRPSVVREIDEIAKVLDLSRSQLMGNLILSGLDDAKLLKKLGALSLLMVGGKAGRKLREALLGGEIEIEEGASVKVKG